jgi:RHS repeat-associated protein
VTTRYLVDNQNLTGYAQVFEEVVAGAVQRIYTYGLSLVSQNQPGGTSFYGFDGHRNVRLLTNVAGLPTDAVDYDAFGEVVSSAGATPNTYLFDGEHYDTSINMYYLRARWRWTSTGRFAGADAAEPSTAQPLSINRYVYAFNRPTDLHDPSGLWPVGIHNRMLDQAFAAVMSRSEIDILKTVNIEQDLEDGQQLPSQAFQHAMRDGDRPQSAEEAEAQYNGFLSSNFREAVTLESVRGEVGDIGHVYALKYLGQNFHAMTDELSPFHHGFQAWTSDRSRQILHGVREFAFGDAMVGQGAQLIRAEYDRFRSQLPAGQVLGPSGSGGVYEGSFVIRSYPLAFGDYFLRGWSTRISALTGIADLVGSVLLLR